MVASDADSRAGEMFAPLLRFYLIYIEYSEDVNAYGLLNKLRDASSKVVVKSLLG